MNISYILQKGKNKQYKQWLQILIISTICVNSYASEIETTSSVISPYAIVSPGDRVINSDELKKASFTNLWDAFQILEPSLKDESQDIYGDMPGYLPSSVSIRGKKIWSTKIDNPYLPLFIIDGARVPLRQAMNLDINDIDKIIIYKDAASLSRYGIYGANGVIEFITQKPQTGKIKINYLFDAIIQNADLNSHKVIDEYAQKEVHTDWLQQPIQTAFQHRHKINIEGGDEYVKYKFSTRFSPSGNGVMKKSKNDILGLNSYIEYNFKALHISNDIVFNQIKGHASNYGTYDYYRQLNPEWKATDETGIPYTVLNENETTECINPVYEATLGSFDKTKSNEIYDNLNLRLSLRKGFTIDGSFAFVRETNQHDIFISPSSGLYHNVESGSNIGRYDILRENSLSFEASLALQYQKHIKKSNIGASAGVRTFSGKYYDEAYAGIGIPTDRMAYISFTKSYDTLNMATAHREYDRTLQSILSGHYTYDNRYGLQASINYNRSSLLSTGERNAWFYNTSIYWNIHNEAFMKNSGISRFILNASIGTTGGVGFSDDDYNVTYKSDIGNEYIYNYYLIGSSIQSMPNRNIKWHTINNRNLSLLFDYKKISLTFNYYNNLTKNIIVFDLLPLSTGYENSISNGGEIRNEGIEFYLHTKIIENLKGWSLSAFISGMHNHNKIEKVPDYFASKYNSTVHNNYLQYAKQYHRLSELHENQPLNTIYKYTEYHTDKDGQDILDGTPSYVGSTDDKFRGNLGLTLQYKQWWINTIVNCSLGGYTYDWFNLLPIGDNFYSKNNCFSLSSLQLGYSFTPEICSKMHMRALTLALSGNNLVRTSSAKTAKGILYPYARTMAFSLRVTF